jgi:hypothetical protein
VSWRRFYRVVDRPVGYIPGLGRGHGPPKKGCRYILDIYANETIKNEYNAETANRSCAYLNRVRNMARRRWEKAHLSDFEH